MVHVPSGPYDDVFHAGVAALDRDGGDEISPEDHAAPALPPPVMTRGNDGLMRPGPAVDVEGCPYNECQIRRQCTRRCGRGAAPELPEDDDLGAREYGERSREERCGAERLWAGLSDEARARVWNYGVAVIAPDANGSMHHNIRQLADEWAGSRHAAQHENSMTARVYVEGDVWDGMRADRERLQTDNANLRGAVDMLDVAAKEREGEIERLREALCRRDAADAANLAMRAEIVRALGVSNDCITDIIASKAAERIRWSAAVDQAVEVHLPPGGDCIVLARIANAGAAIERLTKELDDRVESGPLQALATYLEYDLGIDLADPTEHLADRLLRVRLVVLDLQRAVRAKAETLARWKRRAKRAEDNGSAGPDRVREYWCGRAARLEKRALDAERLAQELTKERDGLTLRMGERVKGQVAGGNYARAAREMYENAPRAVPRKATRAKGGRS